MKKNELLSILDEMDEDVDYEVRMAVQPNYPMEYAIGPVAIDEENKIIYLGESVQTGYLPKQVREELGW